VANISGFGLADLLGALFRTQTHPPTTGVPGFFFGGPLVTGQALAGHVCVCIYIYILHISTNELGADPQELLCYAIDIRRKSTTHTV
jgi:hypothetical protein